LGDHFFLFNDAEPFFYRDHKDVVNPPLRSSPDMQRLKYTMTSPVPTLVGRYATHLDGLRTILKVKLAFEWDIERFFSSNSTTWTSILGL